MEAELGLELDIRSKVSGRAASASGEQPGDLPEVRLLLARGRPERLRVDHPEALGEDAEAAAAEDLARVVASALDVGGALDEDVRDRERGVERERRVVASGADLLGPDPARDVHQEAAAVALAVDVPGAVEHLLEVRERQLDRLAARRRVLAHRGVDRAGVAVLDRGRRDAGPVRALGRVAVRRVGARRWRAEELSNLDLPGSAPSSSGRATGTSGRRIIER